MVGEESVVRSWPVHVEALVSQENEDAHEDGEDDQVENKRGHKRRGGRARLFDCHVCECFTGEDLKGIWFPRCFSFSCTAEGLCKQKQQSKRQSKRQSKHQASQGQPPAADPGGRQTTPRLYTVRPQLRTGFYATRIFGRSICQMAWTRLSVTRRSFFPTARLVALPRQWARHDVMVSNAAATAKQNSNHDSKQAHLQ